MHDFIVIWDATDDETFCNVDHIADNGLTPEDVEHVLYAKDSQVEALSENSGNPMTFGYTAAGLHIVVVWELRNRDPRMIYPVTAFTTPPIGPNRPGRTRPKPRNPRRRQ